MREPELANVPLTEIRASKIALRDVNLDSQEFIELVDSIKSQGVISAVSLRRITQQETGDDGKKFILVDGLQRYSASIQAGKTTIPAQIIDRDEAESLVTQIIGNAHRIETKPIDYQKAVIRILGYNPTMTEAQLAMKLNKAPTWIGKILKLVRLNDALKPMVNDGHICVANAVALANLPPEEQMEWAERAQTQTSVEFGTAAMARVKEIRDANRQGNTPGPATFVPITHLRNKKELEDELAAGTIAAALIRDSEILATTKSKEDAAKAGFKLGIEWALNFDPKSIEVQKQKDAERKRKTEEDRLKREAEKTAKRASEAEDNTRKAREAADAARAKAVQIDARELEMANA